MQKELEELIQNYLSSQATPAELKILKEYAKTNPEIKDILDLHDQLKNPGFNYELPEENAFQKMREGMLNKLFLYREKKIALKFSSFLDYIAMPFRMPLFSASISLAMLILGFIIANFTMKDDLLSHINLAAAQSTDLQSSIDAPFFYSNAHFKEQTDGTMEVSFDVSRHIVITGKKSDPLVQDILAQSLINTQNMPARLQYISNTEKIIHPKIKEALISAMLSDEHPIVRQKSLLSLLRYPNDNIIQHALLAVIRNEASVYMRLAAIDYLSINNVNKEITGSDLESFYYLKNSTVKQQLKHLNYNN